MKKLAIIGSGVSGLSLARLLKDFFEVVVFEKENEIGGIAKVKDTEYGPYHMIGGHCFNSKHEEVKNFVFSEVLNESEWNKVERNAKIIIDDNLISYPIELNINQLATIEPKLASDSLYDILNCDTQSTSENLKEWFINNFGKTLSENYFIPYNNKIWGRDISEMSYDWVIDKLPLPNKRQIVNSVFSEQSDKMPHSSFYYPKKGSQNEFLKSLAKGLDIKLNYEVTDISNNKINNEIEFDYIVSTAPLDIMPKLITVDTDILEESKKLKYNKVTTMLWESSNIDETWLYIPSPDVKFHRIINVGSFLLNKKNIVITEAVGEVSENDMIDAGSKLTYLKKPLDYNVSDRAYVVYEANTKEKAKMLVDYYESLNVFMHGRFGRWEYYNMDICIYESIKLAERLKLKSR